MAYLEFVQGAEMGANRRLGDDESIGRGSENTIRFTETLVSRRHAVVKRKDQYFVIADQGSSNGTFVNKNRLHQFVPQPLYDLDEISICSTRMVFHAEGEDPSQSRKRINQTGVRPAAVGTGSARGSLSMVFTPEELNRPSVNLTFNAPLSVKDFIRDEDTASAAGLREAVRRLQAMVRVSGDIGSVTRIGDLLDRIMDSIFDIFPGADRAYIMLRKGADGEMVPVTGRRRTAALQASAEDFPVSSTIIQAVTTNRQSVLCQDAQQDDRFRERLSIVNLSIRSLMCVPFICKDEILGIISVDTMSPVNAFTADDLAMLTGMAAQAAISIKNAELYEAVEQETQRRTQLARYLSPDVVEGVLDGTIPLHLGGERKRGTILFCDIVGFTAMSESLSAVDVIANLNRAFEVVTRIISANNGTLHKFGGDMVMAFWNVLFPDVQAERNAIRSAVQMQSSLWLFAHELEREGRWPIHIGIGLNTGEFAGGNVGSMERMEYTVIGDNINLGKRIESLSGRWQVFVAAETYEPARATCIAVGLVPVMVKGKSMPVKVFSIRGVMAAADNTMLLDIPVRLIGRDNVLLGTGMLTSLEMPGSAAQALRLVTGEEIILHGVGKDSVGSDSTGALGTVNLQLDLPELDRDLMINARVIGVETVNAGSPTSYCNVSLCDICGSDDAMAFLVPGACIESDKLWSEMKRQ